MNNKVSNFPTILFVGPMLGSHFGRIPSPAEELASRLAHLPYRCLLTSSHPNRYIRLSDILSTMVRFRKQVDIVSLQVYSGLSFLVEDIVSLLAKHLGLRLVMVLHGGALPAFSARHPGWVRRVLGRADRLVTPSRYLASVFKSTGFAVTVIPNGMEIKSYPFRLRAGGSSSLIWLRAFHPIYQPEMGVHVVEKLVAEFPDISMQMIGPKYGEACLTQTKKLIAKLGLENRIQIVGYVSKADLPAYLQNGEIFLNTTRYESFGIAAMEAAACGLPIVTTDVGELPFLWQNGRNALTVGVDDLPAMVLGVRRILNDKALAQHLSITARETAEQFDWAYVLPQWEQLFAEMQE